MRLLAFPVPVLLAVLWWFGSRHNWVTRQTLPAPGEVLGTLEAMLKSGELATHIEASLRRVLVGFSLGTGAGLAIGSAMGLSPTIKQYLYPTLRMMACVPLLGWLPVLILWLGIGETPKYVLIANAAFVPVTLHVYQSIRYVPPHFRGVGQDLSAGSPATASSWILLPCAFPSIWTGVRYGLSSCWLILILVELLASSEGLGYMMMYGQQLLRMDVLLAAVSIVGAIGYLLDRVLESIERRLLRWRVRAFA